MSRLNQELIDRPLLVDAVLIQSQLHLAVVLDRVAMIVEQRRVPVAKCLMALLAITRQPDVIAHEVHLRVPAGNNNDWLLVTIAVMGLAIFRLVHDHRIVEHRAVTFGRLFQAGRDGVHQAHVVCAHHFPELRSGVAKVTSPMADIMKRERIASFQTGHAVVACFERVQREQNGVRQSRHQSRQQDLNESFLSLDGGGVLGKVLSVQPGHIA